MKPLLTIPNKHFGHTLINSDSPVGYSLESIKKEAREEGRREVLQQLWNMLPLHGEVATVMNRGEDIVIIQGATDPYSSMLKVLVSKNEISSTSTNEGSALKIPNIVKEAIKELEIGWYQDDKAELFYYEGESHWKNTDLATNKKLTEEAILGELEYIG
jgi:hypothetical protein